MELDLPRLLATLDRHNVAYRAHRRLAAVYHGSPFPTEDADITPDADDANLDRLASALRELNARSRTKAVPEGVPFACDAAGSAAVGNMEPGHHVGDLDVSCRPSGTRGEPDLRRDPVSADIYDVTVQIASLADVIRLSRPPTARRIKRTAQRFARYWPDGVMATCSSFGVRLASETPRSVRRCRQKLCPAEASMLTHLKSPAPGQGQSVGTQRSCVPGAVIGQKAIQKFDQIAAPSRMIRYLPRACDRPARGSAHRAAWPGPRG